MRVPTTAELLEVWESAFNLRHPQRALELLRVAEADVTLEGLSALCLGKRDSLLLQMRERLFGADLNGLFTCKGCRNALEVSFKAADLPTEANPPVRLAVSLDGFELSVRPITSADVLAALDAGSEAAQAALLNRCIEWAEHLGQPVAIGNLPVEVIDEAIERLSEADPCADIQIAVACPACETSQSAPFDVVDYFWSEIDAWAKRILREVHTLACAYGWRESEILALSARRRDFYLGLALA